MLVSHFMITYLCSFGKLKGSSTLLRAHGKGGASATILSFLSVPPSEKIAGGFQQAGKKGGGWGEGIFARLLPFPFRLSKRKAEGGFGGNSAFLLPNQNEASPATLQFIARHHRKILFSLGEKEIRRAQNEKSKEYFSGVWRACRAVAGVAFFVWGLFQENLDISQKNPPSLAEAASYGGRSPPVANREGELRQYELFCLHFKMFRWETLHGLHSRSKRKNGKTSEKTSFCYSYTIAC